MPTWLYYPQAKSLSIGYNKYKVIGKYKLFNLKPILKQNLQTGWTACYAILSRARKLLTSHRRVFIGLWLGAAGLGVCAYVIASRIHQYPPAETDPTLAAAPQGKPAVLGLSDIRGLEQKIPEPKLAVPFALNFSSVTAKSFLAYDEATGEILAERSPQEQVSIASLTKLLTALIAYENLDMDERVTIQNEDLIAVRPVVGLKPGEVIRVVDLINSMIVGSTNDAALALSNHVAKKLNTPFADLMNKKAKDLEMEQSHFSNPLGFDSWYNYSTAMDIKKLVSATQSKALFALAGRKTHYDFTDLEGRDYTIAATNKLIASHEDIEAIKTGLTPEAGGAMVVRAKKDGHSVILIVLGSSQREQDTLAIKEEVFSKFIWH